MSVLNQKTLNETIISYDDALKINLIDENSNQEYLTKFNNIKVKIEDEIFYFSILVKNVQISMKLEYNSYTKWPYPKSVYGNYAMISLGKSLLISGNRQNMGENLTQLHRLSWILDEIDSDF